MRIIYIDNETKEIKTYKEIQKEHNEITRNSAFASEDIGDILDIDIFIKKYYEKYERVK